MSPIWRDVTSSWQDLISSLDQQHGSSTCKTKRRSRASACPSTEPAPAKQNANPAPASARQQRRQKAMPIQSQHLDLRQHQHRSSACKTKTPIQSHTIEKRPYSLQLSAELHWRRHQITDSGCISLKDAPRMAATAAGNLNAQHLSAECHALPNAARSARTSQSGPDDMTMSSLA